MKTKQFIVSFALLAMMFSTVRAQEVRPDSIGDNINNQSVKNDSQQPLSDEVSQIKARLNTIEQERQYEKVWKHRKYWKIGITNPNMERTDGEPMEWKTDFSVFVQRGKTAYLHSKPIAGMVKIGIDYGFIDLSYAKLKLKTARFAETSGPTGNDGTGNANGFDDIVSDDPSGSIISAMGIDLGMHKFDYALHIGPSVSVNPWNSLIVSAYFHIRPTASGILENDCFSYGFGCATAAGLSVAYKSLSVGVEGVWSTIKYTQTSFDEEDEDYDNYYDSEEGFGNLFSQKDFKLKQKGPRFYISLRF